MNVLHLDASILGAHSISREVSSAIVSKLTSGHDAEATVVYRDLAQESPPHLTLASLPTDHPRAALAGPLTAAAQLIRDQSQGMLDEFMAADTVVIGAPMYNFTVPSQLKAWIDRIVVPGKTFSYGPEGAKGLAGEKRVIVAIVRGGFYGPESASVSSEHAESYLRSIFGFIGVTHLEIVVVEGVAAGEETKAVAIAAAHTAVEKLAA